MSNKFKIALLIVLTGLLITGCNSKKKKNRVAPQGNVVFFHNIAGEGELQLKAVDTSQRNSFGSVDFQQFSTMVYLSIGSYGVKAIDDKSTPDTADDTLLLQDAFTVNADTLGLVALSQNSTGENQLFNLALAGNSNERSINVSNLDKDLPAGATIYIIPDTELGAADAINLPSFTSYAMAVPNFGMTSNTLSLPIQQQNADVYVYIEDINNTLIYESGLRTLTRNALQTLILSPNTNAIASVPHSLFYYHNGQNEFWPDQSDLKGQVRIVNTYDDSITVNAETPGETPELLGTLASVDSIGAEVGVLTPLDANHRYTIKESSLSGAHGLGLYLLAAEQHTVIFYGDQSAPDLRSMEVKEQQNTVLQQSNVIISNAAYFARGTTPIKFDVSIYKPGQNPNNIKPAFTNMQSASYAQKRFSAADTGTLYIVDVLEAGNPSAIYAQGTIDLKGGNNYHLVIHGIDGQGFTICQIDATSNRCDNL